MSDGEPRAFFSYSRDDSPFVTRLAADLKTAGISAWLDTRDIPPGREWDRAIEAALAKIPRMILILSPSSAASRNVRDEISFAIDSGKEIFPVLYRTCELPLQVRRLQYVDFRDDYEAGRAAHSETDWCQRAGQRIGCPGTQPLAVVRRRSQPYVHSSAVLGSPAEAGSSSIGQLA